MINVCFETDDEMFVPGANDKGSTRGGGPPHRDLLVPSMGWSQGRRGSPPSETECLKPEPQLFSKEKSSSDEADREVNGLDNRHLIFHLHLAIGKNALVVPKDSRTGSVVLAYLARSLAPVLSPHPHSPDALRAEGKRSVKCPQSTDPQLPRAAAEVQACRCSTQVNFGVSYLHLEKGLT
ncbi:hypothetical protein J0S82_004582 [Galemys pyrenaicus]|uniref:Uncharacterized protein n=1 Tax=Galemys pyrenaicus TaxID=202257 RepID=A0A8J6ANA3_GALPY|nr:hypothetical protein J0S82_004582 [Galemys pyrenaicus]